MAELPSQDYLKSRIDYNPETGEARWKPVDESFGITRNWFNSAWAGKSLPRKEAKMQGRAYSTAKLLYKLYYGKEPKGLITFKDGNNSNFAISNMKVAAEEINYNDKALQYYKILPEDCSELLKYNHQDGTFTHLPREDARFNTRFAGKTAGCKGGRYVILYMHDVPYAAHRVAWFLYYGVDPQKMCIDHIDGNGFNNSISNLRLATLSFNSQAAVKNTRNYRETSNNRFTAVYHMAGVKKVIGTFDTEAEARAAYEQAVAKYKPIYQFTPEEQSELDELYAKYPNVSQELQHRCHALQVKALNHYIDGVIQ